MLVARKYFCRDKYVFVATKVLCFVATKLCSVDKYVFCRDSSKLVATKVSRQMFVATKCLSRQAHSVSASAVMPNTGVTEREGNIPRCQLALHGGYRHVSRVKKLLRQKNLLSHQVKKTKQQKAKNKKSQSYIISCFDNPLRKDGLSGLQRNFSSSPSPALK